MCANVNARGLGAVDLTVTDMYISAAIRFGFSYSVGIKYEQIRSNDVRFHNVGKLSL